MSLEYTSLLTATQRDIVETTTHLLFKNSKDFVTPEALTLYDEKLIPEDELFNMCSRGYTEKLSRRAPLYIPSDILADFARTNGVPLELDNINNIIYVGVLPERGCTVKLYRHFAVQEIYLPIYLYVKYYTNVYGIPDFLNQVPVKDKFQFIVNEAIALDAMDITISAHQQKTVIYYNVKKKKVYSNSTLSAAMVSELAEALLYKASASVTTFDRIPKDISIDLDLHTRGRVNITKTFFGLMITIRLLPKKPLDKDLHDLNVNDETVKFIHKDMVTMEPGLRLFIGETASGKNTSVLATLREYLHADDYKIVSLEMPVEIFVDGIEQIQCETHEEFVANHSALLRQNPDVIYICEMTENTAEYTMFTANTGKVVFSTLHANSIAQVVSRIQDLTKQTLDQIIMRLHSCVWQKLINRDNKLYPINTYVLFTPELKRELYGKTEAEIESIIERVERQSEHF